MSVSYLLWRKQQKCTSAILNACDCFWIESSNFAYCSVRFGKNALAQRLNEICWPCHIEHRERRAKVGTSNTYSVVVVLSNAFFAIERSIMNWIRLNWPNLLKSCFENLSLMQISISWNSRVLYLSVLGVFVHARTSKWLTKYWIYFCV